MVQSIFIFILHRRVKIPGGEVPLKLREFLLSGLFLFVIKLLIEYIKFRGLRRKDMDDKVAIIMGSISDKGTMTKAAEALEELGISYEMKVLSAHRTPDLLFEYITRIEEKGFKVIIAGAGGAAHLPGVIASKTLLPVIGVPIETKALGGLDSLLSMVQMPGGIPVATVGIGNAKNAGLMAAHILAVENSKIRERLKDYREAMVQKIKNIKI